MSEPIFLTYDEGLHRRPFYEMTLEYMRWIDDSVYQRTGSHVFEDVESYVKEVLPKFTSIKPPEGVILIIKVNNKAVGMGALRMLEDDVGEIKRMYVQPEYRGHGLGRKMLHHLEERAKEFGYTIIRLDTGGYNLPARRLYESSGYVLRDKYEGSEATDEAGRLLNIIFMEKKL